MLRACIEPGCPGRQNATRCDYHRRARDNASWQPGQYGGEYRRNRRIVLATSDVCWRCGRGGADTADHVVPRALGGSDALENLRPCHARCNAAAGANVRR